MPLPTADRGGTWTGRNPGGARAAEGRRLFALSRLVQRLAPNLHRWNQSTLFSIDRLRTDIGWTPEYTFPAMVEQTYEWFCREGLDRSLTFDWTFEDQLLAHLGEA